MVYKIKAGTRVRVSLPANAVIDSEQPNASTSGFDGQVMEDVERRKDGSWPTIRVNAMRGWGGVMPGHKVWDQAEHGGMLSLVTADDHGTYAVGVDAAAEVSEEEPGGGLDLGPAVTLTPEEMDRVCLCVAKIMVGKKPRKNGKRIQRILDGAYVRAANSAG